jgi:hypothetical protein
MVFSEFIIGYRKLLQLLHSHYFQKMSIFLPPMEIGYCTGAIAAGYEVWLEFGVWSLEFTVS